MKGLILKDILLLKNEMKQIFILVFFSSALVIMQKNIIMFLTIIAIYIITFYINTFSYDEYNKFDIFSATLPYDRKDIVKSKFVLLFLGVIVYLFIIGIVLIINTILPNPVNNMELITISMGGSATVLVSGALFTPIIYKFGSQKGRMIPLFAVIFLSIGGSILSEFLAPCMENISLFVSNINENIIIGILAVISLLAIFTCYKISCKIYFKKEF